MKRVPKASEFISKQRDDKFAVVSRLLASQTGSRTSNLGCDEGEEAKIVLKGYQVIVSQNSVRPAGRSRNYEMCSQAWICAFLPRLYASPGLNDENNFKEQCPLHKITNTYNFGLLENVLWLWYFRDFLEYFRESFLLSESWSYPSFHELKVWEYGFGNCRNLEPNPNLNSEWSSRGNSAVALNVGATPTQGVPDNINLWKWAL